jgi:hypothetical protein
MLLAQSYCSFLDIIFRWSTPSITDLYFGRRGYLRILESLLITG